jgi:tetratricopeptide (TPR) repeat protein
MDITGLEPRRSDLARGIVIARSRAPLDGAAQRSLWSALAAAGVTEPGEDEADDTTARQLVAAPWLPPTSAEVDGQRSSVEAVGTAYDLDAVWFVKVETGIDGVIWVEAEQAGLAQDADEDADEELDDPEEDPDADEEDPTGGAAGEGSAATRTHREVLYAAPDAPDTSELEAAVQADDDDEDADEDIEEDDEEDDGVTMESHWRNGTPPMEHEVRFPIERYPDILEEYDWQSYGIALKLGGAPLPGEDAVVNAFFALWLSVYQDERADEFEPFQRADIVHDREHRSVLMWVERFAVPATAHDQVHFLLWIAARLDDIVPLAWARFDHVDDAVKARATDEDQDPFVLAGNPFADRFRRSGEEAALAWAVSQSAWSRKELAGMLVEVALEHDPDDAKAALVAERLLRRALSFDPRSDASGYLAIVMIRQHRLADAVALAQAAPKRDVRLLVVGESAEHLPGQLADALPLLDDATLEATDPEELAELVASVARHASGHLAALLDRLPANGALVPFLYNASFSVERPQALQLLRKVLSLPQPAADAGESRTALIMAWNNACIHAHALGDYRLAVELADGGQGFAPENPYIYHSAACAYAAIGQIDRAIEQVKLAIDHDYEHAEKMETDADLAPLQADPRFAALFVDWRAKRADLN